jgi:broad specificity phosphatase PhoE
MPPTLILIRHAEALHNATNKFLCPHFEEPEVLIRIVQNWKLLDPELTDGGVQQCQDLERHLKHIPLASRIEHIITSPMRRTLETTLISLKWLVDSGVPVSVDPMWQGPSLPTPNRPKPNY